MSTKLITGLEAAEISKEDGAEPEMRSWKVPIKSKNKDPDPSHEKGDVVWMTKDGERGSFKVTINSDGKWNKEEKRWEYEVLQTNGKRYGDGELVGEKNLHFNEK